jgi:glycosyltransferase involved in cell wall biosynthesis
MIVLVALAVGVPVIVTPGCGLAEAVENGQCGLAVGGTPQEIAAAITQVITDDCFSSSAATNAARVADNLFSIARVADRLEGIYSSAVESAHGKT